MARDLALEAKLIDNPDDHAAYLVYADFLQSKGDPRGELISLQHAQKLEAAEAHLQKHADQLLGQLAQFKTTFDGTEEDAFSWKRGFIRKAVFSYDSYSVENADLEEGFNPSAESGLTTLLTHPSGALLEDLELPINMEEDGGYFQPAIQALTKHGAPALRSLRIGRFTCCGGPGGEGAYEYEISWTGIGDASALWKAVPRLEKLIIQSGMGSSAASGDRDVLGSIDLPRLKLLQVITGGLSLENLQSIINAKTPELEALELWFGAENYGAEGAIDDLQPLLDGSRFPKLKSLGLCNSEFSNDIARALVASPLVKRLERVSLRYGTLDDDGARALLDVPNLAELKVDIRDNYVSDAVVAELLAKCPGLQADGQQQGRGEDRYVSLSE